MDDQLATIALSGCGGTGHKAGEMAGPLPLTTPVAPDARSCSAEDRDLASVYRRHAAGVSRWVERLAGPGADIEDIVHDVFLIVDRRLQEFRGDAQLSTWLYQIVVRVVQARRRRERRWRWLRTPATGDAQAVLIRIADGRESPHDALERRQATALLYRLLEQLDEKYRSAVVLFELEGISCQEIAAITGVSTANVWARVSRGREKLARAFADWERAKTP
jgi:RNA polymerase sigma-70 factor, ECF subfamily